VADDADAAGDFAAYSEVIVNGICRPLIPLIKCTTRLLTWPRRRPTAAITNTVNAGTLVVNYVGHASVTGWASEKLLFCYGDRCDVDELDNGGRLPFVVVDELPGRLARITSLCSLSPIVVHHSLCTFHSLPLDREISFTTG